jgi:hypothetical protein
MAALECTARDIAGQPKLSLGELIPGLNLPKPLDEALHKLWGFASQYGRHVKEGANAQDDERNLWSASPPR